MFLIIFRFAPFFNNIAGSNYTLDIIISFRLVKHSIVRMIFTVMSLKGQDKFIICCHASKKRFSLSLISYHSLLIKLKPIFWILMMRLFKKSCGQFLTIQSWFLKRKALVLFSLFWSIQNVKFGSNCITQMDLKLKSPKNVT